jgi:hypothetical protein
MRDFLFFASPSSKNQKVLFLSGEKKKKNITDTKAAGNYQNACNPELESIHSI